MPPADGRLFGRRRRYGFVPRRTRLCRCHDLLSPEHERSLVSRAQQGDMSARDRIIEANVPLVLTLTRDYHSRYIDRSDLIQEGILGLCMAVDRFDPSRRVRFGTYAAHWIHQRLQRALARQGPLIHLPTDMAGALSRVQQLRAELAAQPGREPSPTEVGRRIGISPSRLEAMLAIDPDPWSLDALGRDGSRLDTVPDPRAVDPERIALQSAEREELQRLLAALSERDREVLESRFGLSGDPVPVAELARRFRISPEGIRQIQRRALIKLRKSWDRSAPTRT